MSPMPLTKARQFARIRFWRHTLFGRERERERGEEKKRKVRKRSQRRGRAGHKKEHYEVNSSKFQPNSSNLFKYFDYKLDAKRNVNLRREEMAKRCLLPNGGDVVRCLIYKMLNDGERLDLKF